MFFFRFQRMITLLLPFQEIFRIPPDWKNCKMDIIDAMMIICPEILSNEPECFYFEIQILLDACKECKNFKDIKKKTIQLKKCFTVQYIPYCQAGSNMTYVICIQWTLFSRFIIVYDLMTSCVRQWATRK